MTSLANKRQRDLTQACQRERIVTALSVLKKSLSSLNVVMQNFVKYPDNPQAEVSQILSMITVEQFIITCSLFCEKEKFLEIIHHENVCNDRLNILVMVCSALSKMNHHLNMHGYKSMKFISCKNKLRKLRYAVIYCSRLFIVCFGFSNLVPRV